MKGGEAVPGGESRDSGPGGDRRERPGRCSLLAAHDGSCSALRMGGILPRGLTFTLRRGFCVPGPRGPAFLQHPGPFSLLQGPSGHEALPLAPQWAMSMPTHAREGPLPIPGGVCTGAGGVENAGSRLFAFWFCDPGVVASAASLAFVSASVTQRE